MHSSTAFALLAFAAVSSAQNFAQGGVGRFPCTNTQGQQDQSMCSEAAMVSSQQCPYTGTATVDSAGGRKSYGNAIFAEPRFSLADWLFPGAVPTSAVCTAADNSSYFCGFAGAQCISDENCDNGSCSGGVCTGDLGDSCTVDSECSGNVYCLTPDSQTASGTCGGIGSWCMDSCSEGNFLCASGSCLGQTGQCVAAAATPTGSMRARTRRTTELVSRGSQCPLSHTTCALAGSVLGFECIDTQSNLEQCGGCAAAGGSDCTALPGVDAVGCVAGLCEIWACAEGFSWSASSAACEATLA